MAEKKQLPDYLDIIECSPCGIIVSDGNQLLLANQAARALFCREVQAQDASNKTIEHWLSAEEAMLASCKNKNKESVLLMVPSGRWVFASAKSLPQGRVQAAYTICSLKPVDELPEPYKSFIPREQQSKYYKKLMAGQSSLEIFDFTSNSMVNILNVIAKVAHYDDTTVLLLGESGVGKNVIANLIHKLSNRRNHPFVYINCGAIPPNLLESELFGYEKGSFTGADSSGRTGLIESADKGTLFLDEVAELPIKMQVKILHFLNEKIIQKIGGKRPLEVNTRIISATNKNLEGLVESGRFREDLFYRLNVVNVTIPPLRERKEDLIRLIDHYFLYYNQKYYLNKTLGDTVLQTLLSYSWPGNIRELRNIIEQTLILSERDVIQFQDLPHAFIEKLSSCQAHHEEEASRINAKTAVMAIDPDHIRPLAEMQTDLERKVFQALYKQYKSSYKIGDLLQISQSQASRKIKRYIKDPGEE